MNASNDSMNTCSIFGVMAMLAWPLVADQRIRVQAPVDSWNDENEERHSDKGDDRIDGRQPRRAALLLQCGAQGEVRQVDQHQDEDCCLSWIPVPGRTPGQVCEDRPGNRGNHREDQAKLCSRNGAMIIKHLAAAQEQDAVDHREEVGQDRHPRRRNVEEDYPAGVAQRRLRLGVEEAGKNMASSVRQPEREEAYPSTAASSSATRRCDNTPTGGATAGWPVGVKYSTMPI